MKDDCRRTDVEIAKELGIAAKTVKFNIEILQKRGFLFFIVQLGNSAGDWSADTLITRFAS